MTAIDPKYDEMEDFALIDELEKVSGFPIPNAIKETVMQRFVIQQSVMQIR